LKKTTVFPDSQFMGLLWFSRQKTFQSGLLSVTIGARNYEFPFPPPETAKAPIAPGIPTAGTASVASVPIPAGAIAKESASVESPRNVATLLGIVGATFEQGGVEIVDIDPDGTAALAGLKIGDIINSVDGKRVRSMPGLTAALGSRQLSSIVRIGYMFRNPSFGLMQGADKIITLNKQ
jgi:membrane-associated protease RseP (regulator of RpoE activity)